MSVHEISNVCGPSLTTKQYSKPVVGNDLQGACFFLGGYSGGCFLLVFLRRYFRKQKLTGALCLHEVVVTLLTPDACFDCGC